MILERLLELDPLNVLLVLDFLLHILVPLQKFVVFSLSELKSLVQVSLQLLLESIHLILLLLDELGLGSNDLLGAFLHVLLSFFVLEFLAPYLNLMGLLIPVSEIKY